MSFVDDADESNSTLYYSVPFTCFDVVVTWDIYQSCWMATDNGLAAASLLTAYDQWPINWKSIIQQCGVCCCQDEFYTARQNGCFKCHSVENKKDGPAYKDVAAKYRGKPDAEARLVQHITSGEKAKFEDGHEEEHKIIKTKDMGEIKNLVNWILTR